MQHCCFSGDFIKILDTPPIRSFLKKCEKQHSILGLVVILIGFGIIDSHALGLDLIINLIRVTAHGRNKTQKPAY